jgi:N-acetylglucosamine kinase-like BadF-type ATPase
MGIDGGGSKTGGTLINQHGVVLAEARVGCSAIVGAPSTQACAVLTSLRRHLCTEAGITPEAVSGIGLGLSGIDFDDEFAMQHAALSACLAIPPADLTLVNDGIAALWGASPTEQAVIVQHGSGITNAYRSAYGQEQVFDHLNAGNIFDLRNALTALVARMIDGRAVTTPLKEAALRHYGVACAADFAEAVYRHRVHSAHLVSGTTVIFAAWHAGDPAATRLVEQAVEEYACTACAMIRRLDASYCQVAFGGGIIHHAPDTFFSLLVERVQASYPATDVIRPRWSPAYGAAIMSAFHHGLDVRALYEGSIECRQ